MKNNQHYNHNINKLQPKQHYNIYNKKFKEVFHFLWNNSLYDIYNFLTYVSYFHRYAGLQNATSCFCGTSFGRYGRGECYKKCSLSANNDNLSICGGDISNTVYSTGIKVPGPPSNLYLNQSKEDSLSISWTPFNSRPSKFVIGYHIYVTLNKSFDTSVSIPF